MSRNTKRNSSGPSVSETTAKTKGEDSFTTVAHAIAKGEPPKWLALGLEQFSDFVGSKRGSNKEYQRHRWTIERIHYSADYLIKHLPIYLPGIGHDVDAANAIAVLTRIRNSLDRLVDKPGRGGGQRPISSAKYVLR